MNNYIGKICPFCKTSFREGDEIVICNSCDMPHHKDCWVVNQGCTTFGCLGTVQSADGGSNTVTATELIYEDEEMASVPVFCTKCGARCLAVDLYCGCCGHLLQTTCVTPIDTQCEGLRNDLETFVGKNQEYYVPRFREMKMQKRKNSWNWAAFLWPQYWFMYRKMYGYGFAAFGVLFIIHLIRVPLFSLLALAGNVVLGIYANYIYVKWLEPKVNEARFLEEPFKTQFVQKHGGVSDAAVWISLVCWIIIVIAFVA